MNSQIMSRFLVTKLLVVLAMLLSIAGGPAVASRSECTGSLKICVMKNCPAGMKCCAAREKQPAEKPAPVQQRVGREIATTVTAAPFSVLYAFGPAEVKRAPRALFANGHAPEPRVASCIQLI